MENMKIIEKLNNDSPISKEIVKVKANTSFSKELEISENDVFLLNMI